MDLVALAQMRASVESHFLATDPRPWAAPRPLRQDPAQEEYSRCLDPGKYVILQKRASAWAAALAESGVASVESLGPRDLAPWGTVQTTLLTSSRPGTQPAFLHVTSANRPGLTIAYGLPEVVLVSQPVCGCDACDDGSGPLLEALDETLESVVLGEVLIEHEKRSVRVVTRNWGSSSSDLEDDPTRIVGRWSGGPWLD